MSAIVSSSTINFVDRCEISTVGSSTAIYCYSPASSFLMTVIIIALFFVSMLIGYKLFKGKRIGV